MMTSREQNDLLEEISGYCKKLFFTTAVPECVRTKGLQSRSNICGTH